MKLDGKTPPFQPFKFTDTVLANMSSIDWWNSIDDADKDLIYRLLSAVASSSGVERVFSTFGLVQSKLRNRLGTEKAAKLVFLYKEFNKWLVGTSLLGCYVT